MRNDEYIRHMENGPAKKSTVAIILLSIALASALFIIFLDSISIDNGEFGTTPRDKAAYSYGYIQAVEDLDYNELAEYGLEDAGMTEEEYETFSDNCYDVFPLGIEMYREGVYDKYGKYTECYRGDFDFQ